jgi:integrase
MKQYSNYLGKSIEEMYEDALREEKGNVFFHEREYRADMIKYNNYLKKEGRSINTRKIHMVTIKSFFESHGIREPKIKFKRGNYGKKENWGHLLTKEEINKLIEVANPRGKALIKTMALAGMSQKEAREFKIKDLLNSVSNELKQRIRTVEELFKIEKELENKVLTLRMRREKANYDYITFLPPEALRAIIVYLKERQYGRNKKIRIKDTNSPIFLTKDGNLLNVSSIAAAFEL